MKRRDIRRSNFDWNKENVPYDGEQEYWGDLFSCLDLILAGELGEKEAGEDREAEDGGRGGRIKETVAETEEMETEIKKAKVHIKGRLLRSPDCQAYRFRYLTERMGLTGWERFLFLLAFATSYDPGYRRVFADIRGDEAIGLPTLGLAGKLYQKTGNLTKEELMGALRKRGILFRYFLSVPSGAGQGGLDFPLSLEERISAFLWGMDEVGEELSGLCQSYSYQEPPGPVWIRLEQRNLLASYLSRMIEEEGEEANIIQLYGPKGIGKKYLVKSVAEDLKTNLLFVDVGKLLVGTLAELRILFRKIIQESLLLGAVICFVGYVHPEGVSEAEAGKLTPQGLGFLLEEIRREYRIAFWISEEKADFLLNQGLHILYMELPILSVGERACLWEEYGKEFPLEDDVSIQACANQYMLTPAGIREVLWDAGLHAGSVGKKIGREEIRDAVGRQEKNQLGIMATRISALFTWEDLVIDGEQRRLLEVICSQVKYRSVVGEDWGFYQKTPYGRGICAIFYGEPGTGKTMAVQVIANELGLEVYRIDLSKIISKYIGETEKNITDLFRRAESTNALLFFDEADSLFAKRSEVKDSHDRNANAETAHLLQKIEDYGGIAILATNYINNIDEAFKRRIKIMVKFTFPDGDVRRRLWRRILPEKLPMEEEIDFDFFADEFELSGSSIKEILTNAAFCAAAEERGMRNDDLVEAVKMNFAKNGRALTDEFVWAVTPDRRK